MKKLLIGLATCLALVFGGPREAAAQCTGIFASGRLCGNSGASNTVGSPTTLTALFDRALCATNQTVPIRSGGTWVCSTASGNTAKVATISGNLVNNNCLKADADGNIVDNGSTCAAGSGTVTSVGLSFPSGIYTVTNSPVTGTGTLTATPAGTSGGIPYFSSATALASSGALTVNLPVIGGGAGGAPTVGTRSGTTTSFATTTGALTSGDCVSIDGSGNFIAAGGACTTGGGGGTVAASTIGQVPVYTGSTTVTGGGSLTFSAGQLTVGLAGSALGTIRLSGNTSGTTTFSPEAVASGTWSVPATTDTIVGKATTDILTNKTFNTAGTGNVFQINGTGITAVTGTGAAVLASSPSLITPTLDVATATSLNKYAFTTPATGVTLTISDGKTLTATSSLTLSGTDATTMTFPSVSGTIAALNIASQQLSGGALVTASNQGTKTTGTYTVDCGQSPLQFITNGGAFVLAAPASDSSCIVLSTNNASAGAITFSGFSTGSNTGDAMTTTNGNRYSISTWRINGVAGYRVAAHQ